MFDLYCQNYLLKLKYDTKDYADIQMIRDNFNVVSASKFADPFLIHMSLGGRLVAGADVRNLRLNSK